MASRPMRVLAVVPDLNFGGGENRILNTALALDRTLFELHGGHAVRPS